MISLLLLLVFGLLYMPICATLSGFTVWVINRNQQLEDSELFRHFLIMLILFMVLFFSISKTDAARMRLDPQFRMQTELNADPVYLTIKQFAPDDFKQLDELLLLQMSQGLTLDEAFLQARSLLTRLANERLGFADQKSRVLWGRVTADSLKQLEASNPELCYLMLSSEELDQATLSQTFSAENTQLFQQAIIDIYTSADKSMRHEYSPDDQPVDFNAAALEFRAIHDVIEQQFGSAVANQLADKHFPEPAAEPEEHMCAARIFQLEMMLERPTPMAAMLIDSILR